MFRLIVVTRLIRKLVTKNIMDNIANLLHINGLNSHQYPSFCLSLVFIKI
jgi:hypothetical protein